MAFLPPGGPTEIVFSFDTTGSMSMILDEVRGRLQDMIQRLQSDIPGMKISVIAHGDYCDAEHFYVTKHMDFSDNILELCNFVNDVGGTGGGDVEECYELVLRMVREQLSWQALSQKVLIVIGDAYPHEPDYPDNTLNIDWREEIQELTKMGVRIYGVQVGNDDTSELFFQALSDQGEGQYLKLGDFSNICTFIMAICYRERGEDFLMGYETEVRAGKGKKKMGKDLEELFGTLRRDDSKASSLGGPAALLVPPPLPVSPLPTTSTKSKPKHSTASSKSKPKTVRTKANLKSKKQLSAVKKGSAKRRTKKATKGKSRPKREKIYQTNFAYKDYRWSRWEIALASVHDRNLTGRDWNTWRPEIGVKRKCINFFKSQSRRSHMFVEVSVQARPHTKKHVVMFKVLNGNVSPSTWFRSVFGKRKVKEEVERVLRLGCRVFVRRSELKRTKRTVNDESKDISSMYDYAWQHTNNSHRAVYLDKYHMHISSDTV